MSQLYQPLDTPIVILIVNFYFLYYLPPLLTDIPAPYQNFPSTMKVLAVFIMPLWSRIPVRGTIWHPPCFYCPSLSYSFYCSLHKRFLECALDAATAIILRTLLYKLYSFHCCLTRTLDTISSRWSGSRP